MQMMQNLTLPFPLTPRGVEMERRRMYTVVSLFTGAGGLDVGFGQSGHFQHLAAVELDPVFCSTLTANRDLGHFGCSNTKIIQADLNELNPQDLMAELGVEPGQVDVLIGGPPCQTWSTAGRRATVQDPRGMLIWTFAHYVAAFRPKIFVMENVRGLLSGALRHRKLADRPENGGQPLMPDEKRGSAVTAWVQDLREVTDGAYRVDSFEVNAVNYGAPQLRERVLFFGNRLNQVIEFPTPTHGPHSSGSVPFRTLADALKGLQETNPTIVDFSPRKKRYLSMIPEGANWRALPDDVAKESMGRAYFAKGGRSGWWRRLSWDLPCPTVTTLPSHASTSLCHPSETRALSVRECARIQGFPDAWMFSGTAQDQMRQVGNAVPVRLGELAAELVDESLSLGMQSTKPAVPWYRNAYIHSHVRTRVWWKDGKAEIRSKISTESDLVRTSA